MPIIKRLQLAFCRRIFSHKRIWSQSSGSPIPNLLFQTFFIHRSSRAPQSVQIPYNFVHVCSLLRNPTVKVLSLSISCSTQMLFRWFTLTTSLQVSSYRQAAAERHWSKWVLVQRNDLLIANLDPIKLIGYHSRIPRARLQIQEEQEALRDCLVITV